MAVLHQYRLVPTTSSRPDWSLCENQGEALVQARSTGEARALAASAESEALSRCSRLVTQVFASAFLNARLYTVQRLNKPVDVLDTLCILKAEFRLPPGYVFHRD